MTSRPGEWLDERVGWKGIWESVFLRKVPKVNWLYTLGSATLFVVINQMVTGILLTIYYVPTPNQAYDTVQYITSEVAMGWFIRGLHHWGATAMVILVVLHMLRVIFLGSYKFPREVTWFSGVVLLLITLGFGFTGYLLPWDQRAFWATTVGTEIAGVAPGAGQTIMRALRGGDELTGVTLARFYGMHIWVLPAFLLGLVSLHMYLVVKIGISDMPKKGD